jgi:uncharacterized membrane protein
MVKQKHPLAGHVDENAIAAAIRDAESRTTARILVALEHGTGDDILGAAARAFKRLKLHRGDHRNSALFFVVPARRQFAVFGDAKLHERVGQPFWDGLAAEMAARIRSHDLTAGLVFGIEAIGRALAEHFPKA